MKVSFVVAAKAGCAVQATVPAIDADVSFHMKQSCTNGELGPVFIRFDASADVFPWHELIVDGLVYRIVDPCVLLSDGWNLLPPMEVQVSLPWVEFP